MKKKIYTIIALVLISVVVIAIVSAIRDTRTEINARQEAEYQQFYEATKNGI